MLNAIAETKLLPINRQVTVSPAEISTGNETYYKAFVVGSKPAAWTGIYNGLGGVSISKGDSSNERDGNYVYMQKTHVNFNIDARNQNAGTRPPMQYRVICGKSKRANTPAGYTIDPTTSLFLNEGGTKFGHSSAGVDGSDIMMQPLNKRDFFIKSDKKFTLSPFMGALASGAQAGGYSGYYPTTKDMVYNLGYYKKTRYEDAGSFANLPSDLDTTWFIIAYARSQSTGSNANDWTVNVRGTTSFKDV